ncbi:MAG: hypothetical protein IPQ06_13430 [Chitinophagaceae bacterium]|nr:hypothetical protein [Chitinophagaceae bacterium]
MKKINLLQYIFYFLVIIITACTNTPVKEKTLQDNTVFNKEDRHKPSATYPDTLKIDFPAAIFYSPDSFQLQKIKELTEERIFESQTHEYFFQMRNARMVLKKNWPTIAIIEAKNVRYLLFKKSNTESASIDLNNYDPYGLFLFNTQKDPHPADMMNIDSELPFYFDK